MSLYHKVWAADGTMFEVLPEKAADLVLNKGWSNTPPQPVTKASKKARPAKVTTPVADTPEVNDSEDDGQLIHAHYATSE